MYAIMCTRLDVVYALSMMKIYQSNLGDGHQTNAKDILKYLRSTKDSFWTYGGEEELFVKSYINACFQTDRDDSQSQLGFVFCLNGDVGSQKSSRQGTIVDSTRKTKYIDAFSAS